LRHPVPGVVSPFRCVGQRIHSGYVDDPVLLDHRTQAIIKELRGDKIDIIEWSEEPSVFAANALSPAKVSQVRITDINNRLMEVIVGEDQLSLAIGKKGQNVRLATRLVGWEIKIVSEELLKQEIAKQMGKMMASGAPVPIAALEVVSSGQAETLAEKGVEDVEALAAMSIDDLVDSLDISMDEAESVKASAMAIVEAKNAEVGGKTEDESPAEVAEEAAAETTEEAAAEVTEEVVEAEAEVKAEAEQAEDAPEAESTETVETEEAK